MGWYKKKYRQEWVRDTKDSFRRKEQGTGQDVGRAEIRCRDRRVQPLEMEGKGCDSNVESQSREVRWAPCPQERIWTV